MKEAAKDRISNLPDSLLHHIHSFLEIKDVARTSVLSKRWKYIWTTVPALDFTSYDLFSSDTNQFMDFVDGTLHRHSSNVERFVLKWALPLNESRVHSWICNIIIWGNVKELSLDLHQKRPLSMFIPLSLFTSESLISLALGIRPSYTLPKYISFPSLKCLKLKGFQFSDQCWNEELFSNSPVLEELILEYCTFRMKSFCILIPTLKLLKINTWSVNGNGFRDCVFKIDVPKLVNFSYSGCVAKDFVLSSSPELVEAVVNIYFEDYHGAEEISQLLRALALVKCLTVSDKILQAMCSASYPSSSLLTFHNVKMLHISDELNTDEGLIDLLKAVPNLDSLVFVKHMNDEIREYSDEDDESDSDEDCSDDAEGDGDDDSEDNDADSVEGENNHDSEDEGDVADAAECRSNDECEDDGWTLDIVTTGCLFPRLKSVSFQEFVGNPREMKWVRLILRKAKALQMMTIRYCDLDFSFVNVKSENEVMVEIPSFPRASPDCVIKFCRRR